MLRKTPGKVKRPRRVPLDRVHRCSFLKNALVDDCVQLVFLRPPTADARAGIHPDRFVGFIRPYLEEARRILTLGAPLFAQRRVGDGRFCETFPARESVPHPFLRKGWGTG